MHTYVSRYRYVYMHRYPEHIYIHTHARVCIDIQIHIQHPQISQHKAKGVIFFNSFAIKLSSCLGKGKEGDWSEGHLVEQHFAATSPKERSISRSTAMKHEGFVMVPGAAGCWKQAMDCTGGWRIRIRGQAGRGCCVIPSILLGYNQRRDGIYHAAILSLSSWPMGKILWKTGHQTQLLSPQGSQAPHLCISHRKIL